MKTNNPNIAKVVLINVDKNDVAMWLHKHAPLYVINDLLDIVFNNDHIFDFGGDIEKAFDLYTYLQNCSPNSARLIIDQAYSTLDNSITADDNVHGNNPVAIWNPTCCLKYKNVPSNAQNIYVNVLMQLWKDNQGHEEWRAIDCE